MGSRSPLKFAALTSFYDNSVPAPSSSREDISAELNLGSLPPTGPVQRPHYRRVSHTSKLPVVNSTNNGHTSSNSRSL